MTFIKRILTFYRPFWKYLIAMIAFYFIAQLIGTLSPFLFGKSIDAVTHRDAHLAFVYIAISFAFTVFQSIVLLILRERTEIIYLDDKVQQYFSEVSLKKIVSFSVGQHHNEHSGVKQSVINKGQNALSGFTENMIYQILPGSMQVLVTLIILAIFDWRIAITATVFVVIYIAVSIKRNNNFIPKIEKARAKRQGQQKVQSELYRNATLVISEGQQEKTLTHFSESYESVNSFIEKMWLRYLNVFYLHRVIIIVGQYATLFFGVYLIIKGYHSVGMFVTLFSWTSVIFGSLQQIVNSSRNMLMQTVEIKKYFALLDIAPDIQHDKKGVIPESLRGEIVFKDVSFAYPYRTSQEEADKAEGEVATATDKREEHVISDISLTIPAGAKIGFVGMSGSGKSTIINLIRRYYDPTKGSITIDGIPLVDIDLQWLRSHIGNVDQKIDLFDKSIRENILFGVPQHREVTEEELLKVVSDASLDDFIAKLQDHGLDTVIGEGGIKVSGGERQRIGIARALIKNPTILIFDEATSALDSINEKLIHDAINKSAKGRTTIIIAHRLSTVMDADAIYVVANGVIVDHGTHTELEQRCAEYQALIKNQILTA